MCMTTERARSNKVGLRAVASIAVTGAIACGATSPGGPSQPDRGLVISPTTTTLRIAETVQLMATLDGQPVAARWSTSDPAVLALDSTGMASGVAIGNSVVTATVDSTTASRTVQVVSDYRGRFSGLMVMTRCERISGDGPLGSCVSGARLKLALTIERQTGASVSGTLDVFEESTIGSVTGAINEVDHLVNMTGTLRSAGEGTFVVTLEQWDTSLADSGRSLVGTFAADTQYVNGFGPQHQKRQFSLTDIVRQ